MLDNSYLEQKYNKIILPGILADSYLLRTDTKVELTALTNISNKQIIVNDRHQSQV